MLRNTNKATASGAAAGTGGSALLVWLAAYLSGKWSMPVEAVGAIVAPVFGFFTALAARWAAKLNPNG